MDIRSYDRWYVANARRWRMRDQAGAGWLVCGLLGLVLALV